MSNTATETETEQVVIEPEIDWDLDWTVLDELDFNPDFAEKCQAVRDNYECPNKATLVCRVRCCGARLLLCEDCFFTFYKAAKVGHGMKFSCRFCKQFIILTTAHMTVVRRIK